MTGCISIGSGIPAGVRLHLDKEASVTERFAGDEFVRYLGLYTGRAPGQGSDLEIYLGKTAAERFHISVDKPLKEDDYIIIGRENSIGIHGGSPRAVLYGVYTFMDVFLGIKFPLPGVDYVPPAKHLVIEPFERRFEPAFSDRIMIHHPIHFKERTLKEVDWMVKMRFSRSHPATQHMIMWNGQDPHSAGFFEAIAKRGLHLDYGGHTMSTWMPVDKYFDDHPEFFALVDGQRSKLGNPCYANTGCADVMAENILAFLEQYPQVEGYDIWNADVGNAICSCADCLALDNGWQHDPLLDDWCQGGRKASNGYMSLVNNVHNRVRKHNPHVSACAIAYHTTLYFPERIPPEQGVRCSVATIDRHYGRPLNDRNAEFNCINLDILNTWIQNCPQTAFYGYYTSWAELKDGFFPTVNLQSCELRCFREMGIRNISTEIVNWQQLNMYAFGVLSWNPNTPVDQIIGDFCQAVYGAGAGPMTRFWAELEKREHHSGAKRKLAFLQRTPQLLKSLRGYMAEARDAARQDEASLARIERVNDVLEQRAENEMTFGDTYNTDALKTKT